MNIILFISEINIIPSTYCGGGSEPEPVQSDSLKAEEEEGKSAKEKELRVTCRKFNLIERKPHFINVNYNAHILIKVSALSSSSIFSLPRTGWQVHLGSKRPAVS